MIEISFASLSLFEGIPAEKIGAVTRCLDMQTKTFEKGESLLPKSTYRTADGVPGQETAMFYLAEGAARITQFDSSGSRTILDTIQADSVVFDAASYNFYLENGIDVVATEPCVVMKLVFTTKSDTCQCCIKYANIIRNNLVVALTENTSRMMKKIFVLSGRNCRERILAYLREESQKAQNTLFTVELNRQEMADYLCMDRSALSRELGNLRQDGLIDFEGNSFKLLA